jgi:putative ABC transport system permease protein
MTGVPAPPRLGRALLRLVVPAEVRDVADGDLHELYVERRAGRGAAAAAAWYWLEVASFAMRFTLDRATRAFRGLGGLVRRGAIPSALDLRLGARLLARSPGLALVGGLGMAVAVALGAGAHAVVNSYFYPELPLHEGDRVVALGKYDRQRRTEDERLLHDFLVWRQELRSIVDLGAFRTVRRNLVPETGQGEPITLAEMTASGFRVARVAPLLGRPLLDADERPGAPPVVVIGHDVWQSRFAGAASAIGRELRIGLSAHTIVGVMPEGFAFPISHQYWVPLRLDPDVQVARGSGPDLDVFGRLAPGATKQSAQAELSLVAARLAADGPAEFAFHEARIVPYTDVFLNSGDEAEAGPMAAIRYLIGLLLVIVAMNVAVLVYARTVTRTAEIGVRTALGATRGRIVAQLFGEAFVLTGLAALVGLGMVSIGLGLFDRAIAGQLDGRAPFWIRSGLSAGTVLYALALSLLGAAIVGVIPALRATGTQLRVAMGSLGGGGRARLGATWTALIVAQIAITVAVLPPALLKGEQTVRMALQPSGFAAGEYLSTRFIFEPGSGAQADGQPGAQADGQPDGQAGVVPDAERDAAGSARATMTALLERLAAEPGVVGATVSAGPPWAGGAGVIEVEGADMSPHRVTVAVVDTSYFALFGTRVVAGQAFTAAEVALLPGDRPVIVNRAFVTELLGDAAPVGRRLRYHSYDEKVAPWLTIVGVVEDFPARASRPGEGGVRTVYHLEVPGDSPAGLLTIRLRGQPPEAFAPTLRRHATSVDPLLQLSATRPLDGMYRDHTRGGAQLALVITLITGSVLLLSTAGIHALVSFTVNQRRREIGIRSALGAPARRVITSVLARAAKQLALGIGFGLVTAVSLDLLTGGELLGGNGLLLVPVTAAFMLGVGLLAAAGPARRGLRVQPTETLRAE